MIRSKVAFSLLLLSLALTACSAGPAQRLWLRAPGWSRAMHVGTAGATDAVQPVLADEAIYLIQIERPESRQLQVVVRKLDLSTLQEVWRTALPVEVTQPDEPQLVIANDTLVAAWMNSRRLFAAKLDLKGRLTSGPDPLATDVTVNAFDLAVTPSGDAQIWFAGTRQDPGLYLIESSRLSAPPLLLDPLGQLPSVAVDQQGTLHAIWAHYPPGFATDELLYASYPAADVQPGMERVIHQPRINTSGILTGPWLGLDAHNAYVLWTVSIRTGQEAGRVDTDLISFPLGQPPSPSDVNIMSLGVPRAFELPYQEYPLTSERFDVGQRVPYSTRLDRVPPLSLAPVASGRGEAAIAVRASIDFEFRKTASQIGTLFLREGVPDSTQLLTFTSADSAAPAAAADEDGNLYLTWLEPGAGGYDLYLATTNQMLFPLMNHVDAADVQRLVANTLFGLASGAVISPFLGTAWLILPLIIYGLTGLVKRQDSALLTWWSYLRFAIIFASYQLAKLFSIPGITRYVPFSAWIPLPGWVELPLQILVPVSITLFSIWLAWRLTFGRKHDAPLYFVLIYVGVDTLLTLSVYGVIFFNIL